ncbi:MAG: terminase, partial [Bacilli bacterium]|nr:terminase [Bacilli bacterium]
MEFYIPISDNELSQRKIEEYTKFEKIINQGRRNPVWFSEEFFGIQLMDYQRWVFMESWYRPFVMWLMCRGAGKSTEAADFLMTKMLLIPNYYVYISTTSAAQSIETFTKLESLALQRIPSFKSCTDIFAREVEKSANSDTGFLHNPAGHSFRSSNNSQLLSLSSNLQAIRGKRGAVLYDETAWQTAEQFAVTENFINVDSSFSTTTSKIKYFDPIQMPLQLLYCSSAGDITYPFYEKYKTFSKKMFLGNTSYFVADLNAHTVLNYSSINGEKIKSHLTQSQIDKAIEEDPDLADRELFNKFRRGGGQNSVIRMETIIKNSTVRPPLLYNDTGKKKFILCYDPARNFDGSILTIFQIINDKEIGYKLQLENMISMVDSDTKKKTPLPMPEQLKIIKKNMILYNGERSADWENIDFYIDAGSGGGGISAVADQLMEDWKD